uniref:Uncharacterized protein n=1 Tax=Strigamia maritima TaxID=126957 RepID=T1IQI4_STRMM
MQCREARRRPWGGEEEDSCVRVGGWRVQPPTTRTGVLLARCQGNCIESCDLGLIGQIFLLFFIILLSLCKHDLCYNAIHPIEKIVILKIVCLYFFYTSYSEFQIIEQLLETKITLIEPSRFNYRIFIIKRRLSRATCDMLKV